MRAFRLCRSNYPPYDGEGARRAGGRWNSKGVAVVYMSENRSLALLEILVHLSGLIPDRYVLGAAEIPNDLQTEELNKSVLPGDWATLDPGAQALTRQIGDAWIAAGRSAILSSFGHLGRAELRPQPVPSGLSAYRVRRAGAVPVRLPVAAAAGCHAGPAAAGLNPYSSTQLVISGGTPDALRRLDRRMA